MEKSSKARLHSIFSGMKQRCYNSNTQQYKFYGAKGITICDEWMSSDGVNLFVTWALKNGYNNDLSIDRINPKGPYSPENCRWIPMFENSKRRPPRTLTPLIPIEYVYPAIFHLNDDGSFTITYPDLPSCISEGKSLGNAMYMAQAALTQWIEYLIDKKQSIPPASQLKDITVTQGEFVNLIRADVKEVVQ